MKGSTTVETLSRRDFIATSAMIGGGLLVGCQHVKTASGDHTFSPWIKITPNNNVILVLDRVEMGQGTATGHALMIAEELDLDPSTITFEHAPAAREYDNPEYHLQLTGGSNSTKSAWGPLREAAAAVRLMLVTAAASRFGVPIEDCRTEGGRIVAPNGQSATYGDVASAAAGLPVPKDVRPRSANYRLLGKEVGSGGSHRIDARSKVDGSAIYGIDVTLPPGSGQKLLVAVVVRCPIIGGKLATQDFSAASAEPGVRHVFRLGEGVAVVADSFWKALKASKKVNATWNPGEIGALDSDNLRQLYRKKLDEAEDVVREGDFQKAFDGATKKISRTYSVQYLPHSTMEPMNCTAWVQKDKCDIWAPTQAPSIAQELAHQVTGLGHEQIFVHTTMIGGGFGRRICQDYVVEAVSISQQIQGPVKVVWTREDDFHHDIYRPMSLNALEAGLDPSGKVTAWRHTIAAQSVYEHVAKDYASAILPNGMPDRLKSIIGTAAKKFVRGMLEKKGVTGAATEGATPLPYAIPNVEIRNALIEPGVPIGFWRSVGHSQNAFVVESFVDECAAAANIDPLEFRRQLLAHGDSRLLQVLSVAAEKAGWSTPLARCGSNGELLGRGIACHIAFGGFCAHVAEVSVKGDEVRVKRVVAAVDCGFVLSPMVVRAQVESSIVFGLSAALKQEITFKDGRVNQHNFNDCDPLRMSETPQIEVHIVPSAKDPKGIGETGLPPIAPAVCNAIFAATGKRVTSLPIRMQQAVAVVENGAFCP